MWSHDPEEWRPINHACDPNTWLEGLDIVARRAIRRGEELTIEYATFCGPAMAPFDCHCGAVHCRRTIRGSDHLLPVIRTIYAEHASDFVRNAWRDISTPVCNGSIEFLDGAPSWTSAREESRS
jgi:D-alanine-D-alanine ligase